MTYTNKEYAEAADQANAQGKILAVEKGKLVLKEPKVPELSYAEKRQLEYPPVEEQLDMIYHDFDGWKTTISEIKTKYPKE